MEGLGLISKSMHDSMDKALSGLNTQQKLMSLIAGNVAHADDSNYDAMEADVYQGENNGSQVQIVRRKTNELLNQSLREQALNLGYSETLSNYMTEVQRCFGSPNFQEDDSLDLSTPENFMAAIDNFFSAWNDVLHSPHDPVFKGNVIQSSNELTSMFNKTFARLSALQKKADSEITDSVFEVNNMLNKINNLNIEIQKSVRGSEGMVIAETAVNKTLDSLARYFNFTVSKSVNGITEVIMPSGAAISGEKTYEIVSNRSEDTGFVDQMICYKDCVPEEAIGKTETSSINVKFASDLKDGRIDALRKIRDEVIPNLSDSLKSFLSSFVHEINSIMNQGVDFSSRDSLIARNSLMEKDDLNSTGKLKISVLGNNGRVAKDVSGHNIKSMVIDSNIFKNTADLKKCINGFFESRTSRSGIGNIDNLQLVTQSADDDGVLDFNFLCDVHSGVEKSDVYFRDIKLTYIDPYSGEEKFILPRTRGNVESGFFSNNGGDKTFLDCGLRFELQQLPEGVGNLIINVGLNADGKTGEMKFVVDRQKFESFQYIDSSKISGDVKRYPQIYQSHLKAAFMDENDKEYKSDRQASLGFLKLTANDGKYVAFDGSETSVSGDTLSAKFGFYDMLKYNSSVNQTPLVHVYDDVKKSPVKLSIGNLKTTSAGIYEIFSGDNAVAEKVSKIAYGSITFQSTSIFGASSQTLRGYASDIIEYAVSLERTSRGEAESDKRFYDALYSDFRSSTGVKLEEELQNSFAIQKIYEACAKVLSQIDEMFSTVLRVFDF